MEALSSIFFFFYQVSMQYPYGSYMGQATPDARLRCDIPHGRGTFYYHDGGVYDGFWNRGNWEGQVRWHDRHITYHSSS